MDKILLILCNGFSCFIISTILFQFMNGQYKRSIQRKCIYIIAQVVTVVIVLGINLSNNAMLNLLAWIVVVGLLARFLYYEDMDKPLRRILESEAIALCMCVCESFGAILLHGILQVVNVHGIDDTLLYCMDVAFSKIILIFFYYTIINRFMKKRNSSYSKTRYGICGIMLIYSLINMIVIVESFRNGQKNYLCAVNMGCIVLADLYLLYYIKIADEKSDYEKQVRELEQQAKIQYEYYLAQSKKYDQTVQILHDVNKHIKSIEELYELEQEHTASEYAKEIRDTLKPLIPVCYTENPILNILLTDKEAIMKEKGICVDINVGNVNLDFIVPIDVTTIFGNLLDNAIEAAETVEGNRYIYIRISSYQKMIVVRIENNCNDVKWRNDFPVSKKGKGRGIGLLNVKSSIEKYDGTLTLRQEENKFIVELFINP